jgi:Glycosyl transferases group 1
LRVVIANFSRPVQKSLDFDSCWKRHELPKRRSRVSLFQQRPDWGFHIYSIGVYLMDRNSADQVEFWDYSAERSTAYHSNGILRVLFYNEDDLKSYVRRYGSPDLFINHGSLAYSHAILEYFAGKCFRVHVPALRPYPERQKNFGAECYLVDGEEFLDDRSMLYVPVVNTEQIYPVPCEKKRDFLYLAACYPGKRQEFLVGALRGTEISGHLHPIDGSPLDLSNTRITTSAFNETEVVELLRTSRIAVYPADQTSNPASMWECVAAGLPIVVSEKIRGGKHLVVPGVTGELAGDEEFVDVMRYVLANRERYKPREYFIEHWDTMATIESYLRFFKQMGWSY